MRNSSLSTLSASSRISRTVVGQALIAWDHVAQAVLDALGDLDLPFAREGSTEPISRMYMHRVGRTAEFESTQCGFGLLFHVLVGLSDGRVSAAIRSCSWSGAWS